MLKTVPNSFETVFYYLYNLFSVIDMQVLRLVGFPVFYTKKLDNFFCRA